MRILVWTGWQTCLKQLGVQTNNLCELDENSLGNITACPTQTETTLNISHIYWIPLHITSQKNKKKTWDKRAQHLIQASSKMPPSDPRALATRATMAAPLPCDEGTPASAGAGVRRRHWRICLTYGAVCPRPRNGRGAANRPCWSCCGAVGGRGGVVGRRKL